MGWFHFQLLLLKKDLQVPTLQRNCLLHPQCYWEKKGKILKIIFHNIQMCRCQENFIELFSLSLQLELLKTLKLTSRTDSEMKVNQGVAVFLLSWQKLKKTLLVNGLKFGEKKWYKLTGKINSTWKRKCCWTLSGKYSSANNYGLLTVGCANKKMSQNDSSPSRLAEDISAVELESVVGLLLVTILFIGDEALQANKREM